MAQLGVTTENRYASSEAREASGAALKIWQQSHFVAARPRATFTWARVSRAQLVCVFILACAIPLAFAVYTQHAWEDFYITFRTSRNLAMGQGPVFNVGDRLHTFTSPVGMLLPAVASVLTGNQSETAALWLYRALCISAFGLAVTLLFTTTLRLRYPIFVSIVLVALLVTDSKSVDFSINGMETAFLLLGFAYAYWAMFAAHTRSWLHLGVAWGCLMWTRPDGFIYIGLFTGAVFLFNQPHVTGRTRREWVQIFLRAAPVAVLAYLPWFLFAWAYYGSPVPPRLWLRASGSCHESLPSSGSSPTMLCVGADPGESWDSFLCRPMRHLIATTYPGSLRRCLPPCRNVPTGPPAFGWQSG